MIEALSTTPSPYMRRLLKLTISLRKRRRMFTRMVNPIIGKLLFVAIGASMWIWMQAYVKVQIALYGENVLKPRNRSVPDEFYSDSFGRHEYAKLTNITMHYVTKGCHDEAIENRPLLVLLHGFLDFWYIWNRQIPVLGEDFCVVAPDLRGYGNTTRPMDSAQYLMVNLIEDVKELLDKINPGHKRRVVLVGHDWGGMISFCFATMYENMIDRMVIINGMHPLAFSKQLFRSLSQMRMSWFMIPFRQPVVPEQYLMLKDLMFFDKLHKPFTTEEKNAHKYVFSQQGALTGALNYYRSFNNDSDDLKKLPYRKINVSTLILWAEKDEFLTRRIAVYNQRWLNNSELVYYARSGHWLIRECSDQVTERIRRFAHDTTPRAMTNTANDRKSYVKCRESTKPTPSRSWILRLFAWLPRNTNLPKLMEE
ncbi:epoxide hydrolase 4-like [Dermacentor albipictus]|uniref:epoxide hydrolase 4-like n=1 Tax=Dermacentor albipictus TaxID=60249 RepID=UPI0031FCC376